MKMIKRNDYKIIEFDDNDVELNIDVAIINKLIKKDIKYEFIDNYEMKIKIWEWLKWIVMK